MPSSSSARTVFTPSALHVRRLPSSKGTTSVPVDSLPSPQPVANTEGALSAHKHAKATFASKRLRMARTSTAARKLRSQAHVEPKNQQSRRSLAGFHLVPQPIQLGRVQVRQLLPSARCPSLRCLHALREAIERAT